MTSLQYLVYIHISELPGEIRKKSYSPVEVVQ